MDFPLGAGVRISSAKFSWRLSRTNFELGMHIGIAFAGRGFTEGGFPGGGFAGAVFAEVTFAGGAAFAEGAASAGGKKKARTTGAIA